ncbi:Trm112 family protein [Psychroflexus sediminis]|uniref:Uncharacterized conserved protein YbaR, Trm112 family n=1 Tax=Psychroflexus sediminis TaxID=470826 RepID=A0A1G7VZ65_9FLAO|nr:Trm112 family protein [Psychroflexus sediminis]SDG64739.1 Uncharacterized conserved protein YbaR, Trm112 family [Psychroflexus sediminis]
MRLETINKLCCPFDKSDLNSRIITKDEHDNVLECILSCVRCKRIYPVISGIPIMSPDEYRDFKFEQPILEKWEKLLKANPETGFKISNGKIEAIE